MYLTEISEKRLKTLSLAERQFIYMIHMRMIKQFERFEKILQSAYDRAKGCGCPQCWRDYENLCVEILQKYHIPDEDGDPEEMRQIIARFAPEYSQD